MITWRHVGCPCVMRTPGGERILRGVIIEVTAGYVFVRRDDDGTVGMFHRDDDSVRVVIGFVVTVFFDSVPPFERQARRRHTSRSWR